MPDQVIPVFRACCRHPVRIRGVAYAVGHFLLILILAFAALLAPNRLRSAQASNGDEQGVRKVMSDFVDDVNRHDSAAFGRLLADDAEFVVVTGQYLKGRKEIEKYHAEIWASEANFKNSELNWSTLNVRFLRPDVAVAHVSAERVYNSTGDKRTMVVTLVFIKQTDQRLITALQNTFKSGREL